jgi:hypothetical protein
VEELPAALQDPEPPSEVVLGELAQPPALPQPERPEWIEAADRAVDVSAAQSLPRGGVENGHSISNQSGDIEYGVGRERLSLFGVHILERALSMLGGCHDPNGSGTPWSSHGTTADA